MCGQIIEDFSGVRQRARETVELRYDQRVPGAAGGERLA
jgi:hypothetical protein